MKCLADQGIATGIHYPVPVHLQEAYRSLGHKEGAFPIAEHCAAEFVSLPMYPELTDLQLDTVIEGVKEAVARGVEV
jgi:dTDP-4-amino-4,6-dideoxygalactose transaminase